MSSDTFKRLETLHHQGTLDKVVDIHDKWKSKHSVPAEANPPRSEPTHNRIFVAADNVDRRRQEGCMNKIKIERTDKLVREDRRERSFNILSGHTIDDKVWINSMGKQAENFQRQ